MFYLTKRIDEKQCTLGDRCMALSDFFGINAGDKGRVVEIYNEGVSIQWDRRGDGRRTVDGFSRDDMQYLAFETKKHPKVDPTVNRDTDALP